MNRLALAIGLSALCAAVPVHAQWTTPTARWSAGLATRDGVRATLYRYPPTGGSAARTVLLLPDVGMTHHAFDFDGRGLAPYLQREGWDVYVVEWRGAGRSEVPFGGYRLEDLLEGDAEAAFARALPKQGKIAVGGVGLGATLALALAARHADRVLAALALQPLFAPDLPGEPATLVLGSLDGAAPWLNLATLTRAAFAGRRSWFEVLFANDGSLDAGELASLRLHVLAPVPRAAALQLRDALREKQLAIGGRTLTDLMRAWSGPTLLVIAPRDNWIHPEQSVPLRDLSPRGRCQMLVLDVINGAHLDYGHLGMLLGREAGPDVFGKVARFLDRSAP
jgi:pimeloyl-ACP methyl ester carboxylesterase